jgi:hypothetical protein
MKVFGILQGVRQEPLLPWEDLMSHKDRHELRVKMSETGRFWASLCAIRDIMSHGEIWPGRGMCSILAVSDLGFYA